MYNNFGKTLKKVIIIFLVITLTYSNFVIVGSNIVQGLISYALDNEDEGIEKLQIKIADEEIFKKEGEKENQYLENWDMTVKLENKENINIEECSNIFLDKEENKIENITTYYKSTKINKEQFLNLLGNEGKFSIYDKKNEKCITTITKAQINTFELEVSQAQEFYNGQEKETRSIITVYEDYIEIEYVDKLEEIKIQLQNYTNKEEINCNFEHNKCFEIIANEETEEGNNQLVENTLNNINKLTTLIKVKKQNEEEVENNINRIVTYPYANAELAMDKNVLSTTEQNDVTYTITLHTEKEGYKLFTNPKFEIMLPSYIEQAEIKDIAIINNEKEEENIFTFTDKIENNKLLVELLGTQEEHVTENSENVQIVINTNLKTTKLMPTVEENFVLIYTNNEEIVTKNVPVTFLADSVVMSAITAQTENTFNMSTGNKNETLVLEEDKNPEIIIKNTIINNTNESMVNAKIYGKADFIGEINLENATVYYSENEEATLDIDDEKNGWDTEYTNNAKVYLIILNLEQKQIIEYSYKMQLEPNITEDIDYTFNMVVYDEENNQKSKTELIVEQNTSVDNNLNLQACNNDIHMEMVPMIFDKSYDTITDTASLGSNISYRTSISNVTNFDVNDVQIEMNLSNNFDEQLLGIYLYDVENEFDNQLVKYFYDKDLNKEDKETQVEFIKQDNKIIISGVTLKANTSYMFVVDGLVNKDNSKEIKTTVKLNYEDVELKVKSETYLCKPLSILTTINSNQLDILTKGNEVEYTINIESQGEGYTYINIEPIIDNLIKITKYNYEYNYINEYNEPDIEVLSLESEEGIEDINKEIKIEGGNSVKIKLTGIVQGAIETTKIKSQVKISGEYIETVYSNIIEQEVSFSIDELVKQYFNPDGTFENSENNPEDKPEDQPEDKPEETDNNKDVYSISGTAWLDLDKNGQREKSEDLLKDITVKLLNTQNNTTKITKTDDKGNYKFEELEAGSYIVIFEYDDVTYTITSYQKAGVEENINSDAILTTQGNKNTTKTDILTISKSDIKNIDLGLALKEIFDLEINKYITKVTVTNSIGTTVYNYDKVNFANVSIGRKEFENSTVTVEYAIDITNKGEVPAYAKTIVDTLPERLTFNSELNTSWYKDDSGVLYCVELAQEEINPGETKTIKLIATMVTTDKAETLTNNVKIEESFNSNLLKEKDINNNTAQAQLLVTVNTGNAKIYITLAITCIAIIAVGMYIIKRKILLK